MAETGVVTGLVGGDALVRIERGEACGKCKACADSGAFMEARVFNVCGAAVGDIVEITFPEGAYFKVAVIVYGGLFAAFVAGVFAGSILKLGEPISFLLGVFGVLALFFPLRGFGGRIRKPSAARLVNM